MAETTTDTTATTSGADGSNTQAVAQGAATGAANVTQGATGVAQPKTYTDDELDALVKKRADGFMGAARQKWEAEMKDKAEQATLAEQGKWKEIAEKKDAQIKEYEAQTRQARLEAAVAMQAAENKVTNAKALLKLVKDDVEFGDNGQPTNLADLVKAAIKDVPGLVEAAQEQSAQQQLNGWQQPRPVSPLQPTNPQRQQGQTATVPPPGGAFSTYDWDSRK